ncbi:MAG: hypothetical protein V3W18_13590 [candidate division Zixibacteria bacterium]
MSLRYRGLITLIFLISSNVSINAQDDDPLPLETILARTDSVMAINDSLHANTKIRYELFSVMNRLDGDGGIKSSDTTIAIITSIGKDELSREIIYSSTGKDAEKKKEGEEFSLSFDDPAYKFSLTDSDEWSYKISVIPKSSPPQEGEFIGTVGIDKRRYFLERFDFEVPDPEGALKEFAMVMDFEPLEGGLVVPVEMKMKGYVKAFLGIIRIRFSGEFRFSNYEILE